MKIVKYAGAATLLLIASAQVSAAPPSYVFDSLSKANLFTTTPSSITGILQNGSTPTTLTFSELSTDGLNRCVPIFLIMLEKPGRYLLNLTLEPIDNSNVIALRGCGLELKN